MTRKEAYEYFHKNAWTLLKTSGLFTPDKSGKGFVCPICGNGSGRKGDGLREDPNNKGYFKCFSAGCGFYGDIPDLIGVQYNLTDSKEILDKACEIFKVELDTPRSTKTVFKSKEDLQDLTPQKPEENRKIEKTSEREQKLLESLKSSNRPFEKLIRRAQENIQNPMAISYLTERGISLNTAKACGIGYLENYKIADQKFNSCILFAGSYASYSVRNIDPNANSKNKVRKPGGVVDIPFGLISILTHPNKTIDLTEYLEPVFIVEGQFDLLSIKEAGGDAISLNGSNINNLIYLLEHFKIKRPLILLLDNDEPGQSGQIRAFLELKKSGFEVYDAHFLPQGMDPNDYLVNDRDSFCKAIQDCRTIFIKDELTWFEQRKVETLLDSFEENIKKRNPPIKTGFKKLDSKKGLDGGLYEGLYCIGATSALGKTAFCLQLADQIASLGKEVLFFALEMSSDELIARSISRYTAKNLIENDLDTSSAKTIREVLDYKRYAGYTPEEIQLLEVSKQKYKEEVGKRLRVIDEFGSIGVKQIKEELSLYKKMTGKAPVVIIDYLQLLQPIMEERSFKTEKQILDMNVTQLKQLSREFQTAVIVISSFNRESYERPVSMRSFKESGQIEYTSGATCF